MKTRPLHRTAGFSLVEVSLALGVATFCLVTVFELLPVGVNTNQITFEQTGAANVASAIAADLRAVTLVTPPASQFTPYYQIPIPAVPAGSTSTFTAFYVRQDGTLSGTVTNPDLSQAPHYRVTLYFTSTGPVGTSAVGNPNATAVRILITWPALADATSSAAPVNFSGSFQSLVALVHN